jgi:hypothetical protein
MEALIIKRNSDIGLKPNDIYKQITKGMSRMGIKEERYKDSLILCDL